MARSIGYCNGAYSNQYDEQNSETRKEFGSLFQCYNETFVDDESYRSFSATYLDDVNARESPLGGSTNSRGNIPNVQEAKVVSRESTPNATLRKPVYRRERSRSAPSRRSTTAVYAPISTIQTRQDTAPVLRRSRSTVFYKPSEEFSQKRSDIESQFTVKHTSTSPSKYACIPMQSIRRNGSERRLLQAKNTISVIPAVMNTYVDVNSNRSSPRYCDISETSMVSLPTSRRPTTTNRSATNLAIIPPNHRGNTQSEVPLLAKSPDKFQATKRYSPAKASWVHLPTQPVATESLWLSGVVLLVTGVANCVLCFYIFSKKGRTYYVDLGTVSAFMTIVLGFLGFRTSRWEWFPNRNYVSGFLFLSGLNLIQCCVLGFMAIHWYPYGTPQADIVAGAVCGLSFLTLFLAILGLCASACCRNPPPDNRVAHCAAGFTV